MRLSGPAFTGDITIYGATIVDKRADEERRNIVQADFKMTNQLGVTKAAATCRALSVWVAP